MSENVTRGRFKPKHTSAALVLTAIVLVGAVLTTLAYRGLPDAMPWKQAAAPALPKIVKGPLLNYATGHGEPISAREITVIDGDTILAKGRTVRLVGFDTPETGNRARCTREREVADRATAQLRSLVAGGGLELKMVACACPPGTAGTSACNFGRACGELRAYGRDVGATMISYLLAKPYHCGASSCPPRPSWC